jgi:hypothetical protein
MSITLVIITWYFDLSLVTIPTHVMMASVSLGRVFGD